MKVGVKQKLEILKDGLRLGGEPFYLIAGDIHYFRVLKGGWKRRLQLMKDFGLTAVQIYVPWHLHEPKEGTFCFDGDLDLRHFLDLCAEFDLKVMFRPSGYMCAERSFGGLPSWLLTKEGMALRTSDPEFMRCTKNYMKRLAEEFVPYLSTNGGPIIAVAVENEYGCWGDDKAYLKQLADLMTELGVDVPLFTANGHEPFKLIPGSRPEFWTGVDGDALSDELTDAIRAYQPDKPIYFSEFWVGHYSFWGGTFGQKDADEVAAKFKDALEKGAYVCLYTFCGGTDFGFHNGAIVTYFMTDEPPAGQKYAPFITSYDYDAPISENGLPTEKYYKCKKVLEDFMGTAYPETPYTYRTQEIKDVKLTESADLLKNLDNITANRKASGRPQTMEQMGQAHGFIMYESYISYTDDLERQLEISGLHDRALVFVNGKYVGTKMRDRENAPIRFRVPKEGAKLSILVEELGRISFGHAMYSDYKGILDYVKLEILDKEGNIYPWNYSAKTNWISSSLPLEDLSALDFSQRAEPMRPAFFQGSFQAEPGVDTFISTKGWEKGVIWINGFSLGRYWEIGPQETLYVPGELLKEENTVCVLELLPKTVANKTIQFVSESVLDAKLDTAVSDNSYIG